LFVSGERRRISCKSFSSAAAESLSSDKNKKKNTGAEKYVQGEVFGKFYGQGATQNHYGDKVPR